LQRFRLRDEGPLPPGEPNQIPATLPERVPTTVLKFLTWSPPAFAQRVFTVCQSGWSELKSPREMTRIMARGSRVSYPTTTLIWERPPCHCCFHFSHAVARANLITVRWGRPRRPSLSRLITCSRLPRPRPFESRRAEEAPRRPQRSPGPDA